MRILQVIDSLVPAGAERSLLALAPELMSAGVEVNVAYLQDRPGLQNDLREIGIEPRLVGGSSRVAWIKNLHSLIGELSPDLVHTAIYEADIAGRLAAAGRRTPVVSTLTSIAYDRAHYARPSFHPAKVRAAWALDMATARLTTRLHTVSETVAEEMSANLHYPRDRIDVVARGRNSRSLGRRSSARRDRARIALGLAPNSPVVLCVARHVHEKGLDILVEALPDLASAHPGLVVLVAGREGSETARIQKLAAERGVTDRIEFLGVREDAADLMCAADAMAFPSRSEGMPGAVIEAMALELPIVASDIPQVREVTGTELATLVPLEDHRALRAGLDEVLTQPDWAASRAEKARSRFETHFTIDRSARLLVEFFERSTSAVKRSAGRGEERAPGL